MSEREMTLEEWVGRLLPTHRARRELDDLRAAAAPSAPQGGGDADDGMADASVWTLIALMERVGGERDSGEEGSFITMTLDQVYALEALLTARGHDPGLVDCAPPSAPAPVAGDAVAKLVKAARKVEKAIQTGGHFEVAEARTEMLHRCETVEAALAQDRASQPAAPSAPVGVIGDAIQHLSKWLDLNECECETSHQCGRAEVERTRDQLRALAQQPAPSAPVGVEGVEAALQKWLDWCNEHNEEPEARSGARIAIEALAQQPAACRCVDCGGDQPGHDPHCAYMRDLHGAQPAAVNEAMVERALAAYLRRQEDGESLYGCVTAALTAALAGQQQENGNG